MAVSSPKLPGRLGNPDLTIGTDPRTDPRVVAAMAEFGMVGFAEPPPLGLDSSIEEILEYFAKSEQEAEAYVNEIVRGLLPIESVSRRVETIEGPDGNELSLIIHEPAGRSQPLPGIVHLHGGGMVMCTARDPQYVRWRDELASRGMVVVGVEFRNSAGKLGNHPFPAALNDCASATKWVHENKAALGVSQAVLSGESGGGNLSLATAIKANREGWIDRVDGVYSLCPFISGNYSPAPAELTSLHENEGYMMDLELSQITARAYDPDGDNADNPLAWPYHAMPEDLKGLPPHTISVNELDPFRDEGLIYARKLMSAGVTTISRTVNGTTHGADTELPAVIPNLYAATLGDIYNFASSL